MNIKSYLNKKKEIVDEALVKLVPSTDGPFSGHLEAMRYSLFVGGKRVRPILCLAAAEAVNGSAEMEQAILPVACALECIHTYSLVHDDLPAMDDDDLRRGKPTNHTIYGEAAAILAGDSLLTWAFDLLSDDCNSTLSATRRLAIIQLIARAAGPHGMVGGQALDIASENNPYPFSTLQTIHKSKTGALITSSVMSGAIAAGATEKERESLQLYGDRIGLAFQIVDDLLNATSTTEVLGKAAGSDESRGKATYPGYFGVEKTRQKGKEAVEASINALNSFDQKAEPLRELAKYIFTRSN